LKGLLRESTEKITNLEAELKQQARDSKSDLTSMKESIADRDRLIREAMEAKQHALSEKTTLAQVVDQQER